MDGSELEEDFLQSDIGDDESGALIFGRRRFIELLKQSEVWLFDGTFKSAPPPFKQILTVYARFRETHHVIPVFYCLLASKEQALYESVLAKVCYFILIKDLCRIGNEFIKIKLIF